MISLQSIAGGKRAVLLLLLFLVVALLLLPESRQESLMVIGRPMATVIAVPPLTSPDSGKRYSQSIRPVAPSNANTQLLEVEMYSTPSIAMWVDWSPFS